MAKNLLKGALLGGITYFVWMNVSWMGLGWHKTYMKSFSDESAVASALKGAASGSGVYAMPDPKHCASPEQMMGKMAEGPFAYIMLRPGGRSTSMGAMMLLGLLASFVWSGMATFLLMKTTGLSLVHKIGFVKIAGLLGSLSIYFGQWNWWGFSETYVLVNVLDQAIGWGLVGLVLGKFVVKS
jgi:hypothetical protein